MENEFIQAVSRSLLRENPEVEARIEHGTELNRKGQAHLILKHQDGSAVSKATVRFRQTGHEFKFGCNGFMYRQFDTGKKMRSTSGNSRSFSTQLLCRFTGMVWNRNRERSGLQKILRNFSAVPPWTNSWNGLNPHI